MVSSQAPVRFILCAVGATFSLACHGSPPTAPTAPTARLLVQSDKTQYSLASDRGATPLLVNLGPDRVYAPMNEYVYVERFAGGKWQDRHPWFAVDGVGISFPIRAGDTLTAWAMRFGYVGDQVGTYRFVFEVAFDSLGRQLVPEAQRTSPPFELTP
jgi:hypothetical protein